MGPYRLTYIVYHFGIDRSYYTVMVYIHSLEKTSEYRSTLVPRWMLSAFRLPLFHD